MPALAFGLNAAKPASNLTRPPPKRKAFASLSDDEEATAPPPPQQTRKPLGPIKPLSALNDDDDDDDRESDLERPSKSPKLSHPSNATATRTDRYANLSSLRNAKLEDARTASIDPNVYDYDASYDTFSQTAVSKSKASSTSSSGGPKYMTSLLASSAQRQRDQLRAREKVLQREREAEGDEFADKEKFVTGAYKQQQAEMRKAEEEEEKRKEEEEKRKRQGLGMTEFNKSLLRKEEERMEAIANAERVRAEGGRVEGEMAEARAEDDDDEDKMAKDLNDAGANIVVNDEGEVVDKRQLLSAGLNSAPKKPGKAAEAPKARPDHDGRGTGRVAKVQDARQAQRERQTRMMERQLESMADQQEAEARKEEEEQVEKNKSKVTDEKKTDAKERYLARKREREEAERAKNAGG